MKKKTLTSLIYCLIAIVVHDVANAQVLIQSTGSANIFNINYPANFGAPGTVPPGLNFTFRSNQTVNGASSINLNSIGNVPIKKNFDQDLQLNDIKTGHFVTVIFDGVNWQMLSMQAVASNSSQWQNNGQSIYFTNSFVGIGTSVPGQALAVTGNSSITGTGYFGTLVGNNLTGLPGSVITVDGFGKLGMGTLAVATNYFTFTGGNIRTINNTDNIQLATTLGAYMIGPNTALKMNNNNSIFIGNQAGNATTIGSDNNFMGVQAGFANITGSGNNFFGRFAGLTNVMGNDNIAIGNSADFTAGNFTNAIAIGKSALAGGSNMMVLGGTGGNAVNVGIGTSTPTLGRLEISGAVNNTVSVFGSGSRGISTLLNDAGIGFNQYIGAASNNYSMAAGRSATILYDNTVDAFRFNISNGVSGVGGTVMTMVQRMILMNDGRLGLGTFTNPIARAEIRGVNSKTTSSPTERIMTMTSNDGIPLEFRFGIKTDATPANRYAEIEAYDGGPMNLVLQPYSGNVGINTSVPGSTLHVNGTLQYSTTVLGAVSALTILPTDPFTTIVKPTASVLTLTLPAASLALVGRLYYILNANAAGTITIAPAPTGSGTIPVNSGRTCICTSPTSWHCW